MNKIGYFIHLFLSPIGFMLHEDGYDLHESILMAIDSVQISDLLLVDTFNCRIKFVFKVDLNNLVEKVLFLETFFFVQGGLVALFQQIDSLFGLSP